MLTLELYKSISLSKAFSLQYTIITVRAFEASYNSILTLYTYYREKLEKAKRGKIIIIYILINRIHVRKNKY